MSEALAALAVATVIAAANELRRWTEARKRQRGDLQTRAEDRLSDNGQK